MLLGFHSVPSFLFNVSPNSVRLLDVVQQNSDILGFEKFISPFFSLPPYFNLDNFLLLVLTHEFFSHVRSLASQQNKSLLTSKKFCHLLYSFFIVFLPPLTFSSVHKHFSISLLAWQQAFFLQPL